MRNNGKTREKEVVKKGGELAINSEKESEKGKEKPGEDGILVMQSTEKEKQVSEFNFCF